MTVAEKTLLLKQDFDDVKQAGRFNPIISSENLNGNVSGVAIAVNDVIDMEHNVGCRLSSKNLFDISKSTMYDRYSQFTDDGTSITFDYSTKTGDYFPFYCWVDVIPNTDYVISIGNYKSINYCYIYTDKLFGNMIARPNVNSKESFNSGNNTRLMIGFYSRQATRDTSTTTETVSNIQLEKGTTVTKYTPYIEDFSNIEVSRYGKNLLDVPSVLTWTRVYLVHQNTNIKATLKPNVRYVFYFDEVEFSEQSEGLAFVINGTFLTTGFGFPQPKTPYYFTLDKEITNFYIYSNGFSWDNSSNTTATITNLRICVADADYLEYEPYFEPTTYTAKADGTVEGVASIAPNMTLFSDNNDVVINAHYYKDPDIVISNLQQSVALSGGE